MNMYDYHLHSSLSMDGHVPFMQIAQAAREQNISEICLTEHMDLHYGQTLKDIELNMPRYLKEFAEFRNISPVPANFGVELGLDASLAGEYDTFMSMYPVFDFVICSQHIVDGSDPFYKDFYDTRDFAGIYEVYLQNILDSISLYKNYDVIGHIGYITRYHDGYKKRRLDYTTAPELIDEILKLVIADGKGLELNTSSMDTPVGPQPAAGILKRYKELGGEIITTGSDAHWPNRVANCFKEAYELLGQIGFKYVCTFKDRKPVFNKL